MGTEGCCNCDVGIADGAQFTEWTKFDGSQQFTSSPSPTASLTTYRCLHTTYIGRRILVAVGQLSETTYVLSTSYEPETFRGTRPTSITSYVYVTVHDWIGQSLVLSLLSFLLIEDIVMDIVLCAITIILQANSPFHVPVSLLSAFEREYLTPDTHLVAFESIGHMMKLPLQPRWKFHFGLSINEKAIQPHPFFSIAYEICYWKKERADCWWALKAIKLTSVFCHHVIRGSLTTAVHF